MSYVLSYMDTAITIFIICLARSFIEDGPCTLNQRYRRAAALGLSAMIWPVIIWKQKWKADIE